MCVLTFRSKDGQYLHWSRPVSSNGVRNHCGELGRVTLFDDDDPFTET